MVQLPDDVLRFDLVVRPDRVSRQAAVLAQPFRRLFQQTQQLVLEAILSWIPAPS